MFCNQCGNKIEDNSKFCNFCGSPTSTGGRLIIEKCPECGGKMVGDGNKRHCQYCDFSFTVDESDEVKIKQIEREAEADKFYFEEKKAERERKEALEDEKKNTKFTIITFLVFIVLLLLMPFLLRL